MSVPVSQKVLDAEKQYQKILEEEDDDAAHERFIQDYKSGKIPRFKNHLNLDAPLEEFEKELQSIPLFMNRPPTAEEMESNPDLQALQTLIYDESDPVDLANYHKDQGNSEFKKGDRAGYKKAVEMYTEGINGQDCPLDILSTLYSNRAAANLALGNYRSTVEDCAAGKKVDQSNIKFYFRAAKALCALDRFDEAYSWCDDGLVISFTTLDPSNPSLIKTRAEIKKKSVVIEKRRRKREKEEKLEREKYETLLAAIQSRGITLKAHTEQVSDAEATGRKVNVLENPSNYIATIDSEGQLFWPVTMLYPEYNMSDFIASFCESTTIMEMFNEMFQECPVWDRKHRYLPDNLDVYFDYNDDKYADVESWLVK
eukprot:Ihof_evm7s238 gene=Ihof_evmTU7s238